MSTEGFANLVKFSKILARWNDLFLTRSRHTQHPFSINVWAGILGHTVHNVIEEYCSETVHFDRDDVVNFCIFNC
jgi:hypothetical protein